MASGGSHLKIEFSQKWHQEVQFLERFLGPAKIDHQKSAINKKSTILRFSTPNFNTQLVIPVPLHKNFLAKNGYHLPPEIKVQTEVQLSGTYGMLNAC